MLTDKAKTGRRRGVAERYLDKYDLAARQREIDHENELSAESEFYDRLDTYDADGNLKH